METLVDICSSFSTSPWTKSMALVILIYPWQDKLWKRNVNGKVITDKTQMSTRQELLDWSFDSSVLIICPIDIRTDIMVHIINELVHVVYVHLKVWVICPIFQNLWTCWAFWLAFFIIFCVFNIFVVFKNRWRPECVEKLWKELFIDQTFNR